MLRFTTSLRFHLGLAPWGVEILNIKSPRSRGEALIPNHPTRASVPPPLARASSDSNPGAGSRILRSAGRGGGLACDPARSAESTNRPPWSIFDLRARHLPTRESVRGPQRRSIPGARLRFEVARGLLRGYPGHASASKNPARSRARLDGKPSLASLDRRNRDRCCTRSAETESTQVGADRIPTDRRVEHGSLADAEKNVRSHPSTRESDNDPTY